MTASKKLQMALVLGVALLMGSVCLAKPPASNPGLPFQQLEDQHTQIQSAVDDIPTIIQVTNGDEMDLLRILQRRLTVKAKVDTEICASAAVQCGPENAGPASNLNESPVRLFVHVSQHGAGVEGLEADAFVFANPFYPAGGRAVRKCEASCGTDWFQDGGNGLYSIFLEPLPRPTPDNWQAGKYAATIEAVVTDFFGDSHGTTLVTFDIPGVFDVDQ